MPDLVKHLLIGSIAAHSGKSAIILGLASQLQTQGFKVGYGKPMGNDAGEGQPNRQPFVLEQVGLVDTDTHFLAATLNLEPSRLCPTLLIFDADALQKRVSGEDQVNYSLALQQYGQATTSDLVLVEGPATLDAGRLFGLSLLEMAQTLVTRVLLVVCWDDCESVDTVLGARHRLGEHLMGVVFNDVPLAAIERLQQTIVPFLEAEGIPVLGLIPHSELLRSVSVGELVNRLQAKILSAPERMDLMVESLCIGAMNVNSALEYFRRGHNMAVVTGSDRADLQLAALETSTQCLILTGRTPPSPEIIARAEEMEVPILVVHLDTLTTVEIIEQAFQQVSFHEAIKARCMIQMSESELDVKRLLGLLDKFGN